MCRLSIVFLKDQLFVKSSWAVRPTPRLRLSRGTHEVFIYDMMVDIETFIQDKHVSIFVEINGLAEIMRVGGKWLKRNGRVRVARK